VRQAIELNLVHTGGLRRYIDAYHRTVGLRGSMIPMPDGLGNAELEKKA
jgi:hypothetical protein